MDGILELPVKNCKECGRRYRAKRCDQKFCTPDCKKKWFRRAQTRGAQAYDMLLTWRKTRGGKKGILSAIALVVDGWIADDAQRQGD